MDSARRFVTLMVLPLAVIALGLFAAVLVPYGSPTKWAIVTTPLEDFSPFWIIHIGAGLLALALAIAARRGRPPGHLTTMIALASILGATVVTVVVVKAFSDGGNWTPVLVFVAPVAIALVISFHALRMRGWDRTLFLGGAFAVSALPYSCPLVPGVFNNFSGGLLHVLATLTVLVLFARGMRGDRVTVTS